MRNIASDQNMTPETYLLIWLGLVGNCVGLSLPPELFVTEMDVRTPEHIG